MVIVTAAADDQLPTAHNVLEGERAKRFAKVDAQRATSGDLPYRFDRTHTLAEVRDAHAGLEAGAETDERVSVAGRLMLHRHQGKLVFGQLRDRLTDWLKDK